VLFATAAGLIAALTKAATEGRFDERLKLYCVPRLLIIDGSVTCRSTGPERISSSSSAGATSAGR
jgi:hypothetical protein